MSDWIAQLNVRDLLGTNELIDVTAQTNGQAVSGRIHQPSKRIIANTSEFWSVDEASRLVFHLRAPEFL